jgi:hypothetical protein
MESGSIGYDIVWSFDGSVTSSLSTAKSYALAEDLRDPAQNDRVIAKPNNGEWVMVGTEKCVAGNWNTSSVTMYGANRDWYNASDTAPQGMHLTINCRHSSDGSQHRYRWGYTASTPDCVILSRPGEDAWPLSLATAAECQAQHYKISSSGKATLFETTTMPFTGKIVQQ